MSAGAGSGASPDIDKINKIHAFLAPECLSCMGDNFGKRPKSPFRYGQHCKLICAFTAAGVALVMRLLEVNPGKGIDIHKIDRKSDEWLPYTIRVGGVEKAVTGESFFRGISNAIGLLWDWHSYEDGGPPEGVEPAGIRLAINRGLDWFVPTLQEGINIVSFYDIIDKIYRTATPHHSFVYKTGADCILADSWSSMYSYKDKDGEWKEDGFVREFTVREIPTAKLEAEIATLKLDPYLEELPDETWKPMMVEKVRIMRETFLGPPKENYANKFPRFTPVILKQSILDSVLEKGFAAEGYMFGGRNRKKPRRHTVRRKITKRRRTMRRRSKK